MSSCRLADNENVAEGRKPQTAMVSPFLSCHLLAVFSHSSTHIAKQCLCVCATSSLPGGHSAAFTLVLFYFFVLPLTGPDAITHS